MFNWKEIKVKKVTQGHMFIGEDGISYILSNVICRDSQEYLGDGLKAVFLIKKIFKQKIWVKKYGYDHNNRMVCDIKTKDITNLSEYLPVKHPNLFKYKHGKDMKFFIKIKPRRKLKEYIAGIWELI